MNSRETSDIQPEKEILSVLSVIRHLKEYSRQEEIEGSRRIYWEALTDST